MGSPRTRHRSGSPGVPGRSGTRRATWQAKARDALNVPGLSGGLGGAGGDEEDRATRLLQILADVDEGELPAKVKAEPRGTGGAEAQAQRTRPRKCSPRTATARLPVRRSQRITGSARSAAPSRPRPSRTRPDWPRPCSGELPWVDVEGQLEPLVALTTVCHGENDADFPFDEAATFAEDPTEWTCFPFWCHMEKLYVPGENRYRETVSLDCGDPENTWTLQVELDFCFKSDQNAAGETLSEICRIPPRRGPSAARRPREYRRSRPRA